MKNIIVEDGREREVIKIACDVTEDNAHGFYIGYRDTMKEDETEFGAEVSGGANIGKMNKTQLAEYLIGIGVEVTGQESKAELLEMASA